MSSGHRLALLLPIVIALGLLYPGLTEPVLTLSGELEKSEVAELGIELIAGPEAQGQSRQVLNMISAFLGLDQLEGRVEAYRSTRSIAGMARELADGGNTLVAVLIVTFSVVIPVGKLLLQAAAVLAPATLTAPLLALNGALSKWSMADVFVMAMLVAWLAGKASAHDGGLLIMQAELGRGFWFFLAYCLFAIAAGILVLRQVPAVQASRQNSAC